MASINLSIKYHIDTTSPFSAQDIKDKYLSFLPNDFNCNQYISDETIEYYIKAAKQLLEEYLGMLISRKVITESRDFFIDDWLQWGFIKTTYPVQSGVSLSGYLGDKLQVTYPS